LLLYTDRVKISVSRASPFRLALEVFKEKMETLNLSQLLHLIDEVPAYYRLVAKLQSADGSTRVTVLEAAKPFLIAALYRRLRRPLVLVTAQPDNARKLYDQLVIWCGCEEVRLLPESDALPYERVISDTPSEQERQ
jgi:transcription-repair coupling factor (superfamily II helicase)